MKYTPHHGDTAPRDGRVVRGWFTTNVGATMIAVSWSKKAGTWVDLLGKPVPAGAVLDSWGDV